MTGQPIPRLKVSGGIGRAALGDTRAAFADNSRLLGAALINRSQALARSGQFDSAVRHATEAVELASVEYSLMILGTAVFLAGLLQLFAGWLRLGQWFRAVSPAVIMKQEAATSFYATPD